MSNLVGTDERNAELQHHNVEAGNFEHFNRFDQAEPLSCALAVVRVLAGPKGVIVGIVCEEAEPDGIVTFSVRRDAPLDAEDHVRVVIGPFLDGRSGYVFAVNPSGARYDGLLKPVGKATVPIGNRSCWTWSRRDRGWRRDRLSQRPVGYESIYKRIGRDFDLLRPLNARAVRSDRAC